MRQLKVAKNSNHKSLARAIANSLKTDDAVQLVAIGEAPTYKAIKAIATADEWTNEQHPVTIEKEDVVLGERTVTAFVFTVHR